MFNIDEIDLRDNYELLCTADNQKEANELFYLLQERFELFRELAEKGEFTIVSPTDIINGNYLNPEVDKKTIKEKINPEHRYLIVDLTNEITEEGKERIKNTSRYEKKYPGLTRQVWQEVQYRKYKGTWFEVYSYIGGWVARKVFASIPKGSIKEYI